MAQQSRSHLIMRNMTAIRLNGQIKRVLRDISKQAFANPNANRTSDPVSYGLVRTEMQKLTADNFERHRSLHELCHLLGVN